MEIRDRTKFVVLGAVGVDLTHKNYPHTLPCSAEVSHIA